MGNVMLDFIPKFEQSERIAHLAARNRELALSGKRNLGGWGGAKTGSSLGDHACWIHIGPFPHLDDLPSNKNGYEMSGESWAADYAFLLDHTPPAIHPHERIVGEIYWEMHMLRRYKWGDTGDEVAALTAEAEALGAYGTTSLHTCPDLMIGLTQGYSGVLERVRASKAKYERLDNERKVSYLRGLEAICLSCMRYIQKYADLAERLAADSADPEERRRFMQISECCNHIATEPPRDYYEAVQWMYFAILFDRTVGHGNGYGSIDAYLIKFYQKSMADGSLTRDDAREYVAEMYMKLRGHFFCMGGRNADGSDATNEMSWVALEAYDLVGDYNNLGVMWHSDMDEDFYAYTCDVLARHGESIPVLANYDMMYESELRSGIPHGHAWTVAYSGCQWFCIPGREHCDQDCNSFIAINPMRRAMARAIKDNAGDFETLFGYFREEATVTAKALQAYKRAHDEYLGDLWPEMFTSLMSHGPIERGLDMVAPRGVDYQYTSVNVLGIPNVADSFYAIKKLVYEKNLYTLAQVEDAVASNWAGNEAMRLRFYNEDKYGNDIEEVDAVYVRVCEAIRSALEGLYNQKGQPFRPSLFHFQGHLTPEKHGATPDGRRAEDYLAHGVNPTKGVNVRGLLPTANSLSSVKGNKFQGSPLQVDIQPKFFDGKEEIWEYIRNFSVAYFKRGGVQINLHIMDLSKLADAIEHPEKPEYQNIIVRVTGYASRFISLPRSYQEEFVARHNYDSI
ncbi:MAG: pyruvate formate lyase family protein [Oscillospiraceae bacterium]|nr:pyruvate formate lyase family protein [Oscillospiraceae bacterium]